MAKFLRCVKEWKEDSIAIIYDAHTFEFSFELAQDVIRKMEAGEIYFKNVHIGQKDTTLEINYTVDKIPHHKGLVYNTDLLYNSYVSRRYTDALVPTIEIVYKDRFFRIEIADAGIFPLQTKQGEFKTNIRINRQAINGERLKGVKRKNQGGNRTLTGEKNLGRILAVGYHRSVDGLLFLLGGGLYAIIERDNHNILCACYDKDEPDGYWEGLGLTLQDGIPVLREIKDLGEVVKASQDDYRAWYVLGNLNTNNFMDIFDRKEYN